jgi:hypothetical protein
MAPILADPVVARVAHPGPFRDPERERLRGAWQTVERAL